MDTREMFNFLDSFIAGFGKRYKKDVNNAIFITSEKFEMDFPLEWRGAGRSGFRLCDSRC